MATSPIASPLTLLRESEARLQTVIRAARDAIVMMDQRGKAILWSPAAESMFGWTAAEAIGRDVHELLTPDRYFDAYAKGFATFRKSGTGPASDNMVELEARRKDGHEFPVELSLSAIESADGWLGVGVIRDITERKRFEKELTKLASSDPLTGVANRRSFMQRAGDELERAKRYDRPFSIAMIDLDHFKRINDAHGHQVGDEVLKTVATICVDTLRKTDTFGRLGGEEFAVLMPETEYPPVMVACERLRLALAAASVRAGETVVTFTASIGVSIRMERDDSLDDIIKRADDALYEAKNRGRNRVVFRSR